MDDGEFIQRLCVNNMILINIVCINYNIMDGYLNMKIQVYYNTIHSYYIYILF